MLNEYSPLQNWHPYSIWVKTADENSPNCLSNVVFTQQIISHSCSQNTFYSKIPPFANKHHCLVSYCLIRLENTDKGIFDYSWTSFHMYNWNKMPYCSGRLLSLSHGEGWLRDLCPVSPHCYTRKSGTGNHGSLTVWNVHIGQLQMSSICVGSFLIYISVIQISWGANNCDVILILKIVCPLMVVLFIIIK